MFSCCLSFNESWDRKSRFECIYSRSLAKTVDENKTYIPGIYTVEKLYGYEKDLILWRGYLVHKDQVNS